MTSQKHVWHGCDEPKYPPVICPSIHENGSKTQFVLKGNFTDESPQPRPVVSCGRRRWKDKSELYYLVPTSVWQSLVLSHKLEKPLVLRLASCLDCGRL